MIYDTSNSGPIILSFSVNVSQYTLAKPVAKSVMPVGNCIVSSMESSPMAICHLIRLWEVRVSTLVVLLTIYYLNNYGEN